MHRQSQGTQKKNEKNLTFSSFLAQFYVTRAEPVLKFQLHSMKNNLLFAFALLIGGAAIAQTTPAQPATDTAHQAQAVNSLGSAYVSHPERLQGLTTETLLPTHIFPVLGNYTGSGASTESLSVSLDATNKGIVWIEGLPQGRFKAVLKQSPATYKIPAQTAEGGKSIAEGTLYLNPNTGELTLVLGQPFNDANPIEFLTIPTKQKGWHYTGKKAFVAAESPASPQ